MVAGTNRLLRESASLPPASLPRPYLLCTTEERSVLLHALVHVDYLRARHELHRHRRGDDGRDPFQERKKKHVEGAP